MGFFVCLLLLLSLLSSLTPHSCAVYCVCRSGLNDSLLQNSLDYACGNGADCSAILQNGGCYQPNTVKSHCDYAVNSYFQRKAQVTGSCDFSSTAMQSASLPTTVASTCVYQATPSTTGTPTGNGTATPTPTPAGNSSTTPAGGSIFTPPPTSISPTGLDGSGATPLFKTNNMPFTSVLITCLLLLKLH